MSEAHSAGLALPDIKITFAVGALLLQSATALIWAGSAAQRIQHLEDRSITREIITERTARLEENVASIRESVARIENKLDRVSAGGRNE